MRYAEATCNSMKGADLMGADLDGADLEGAEGIDCVIVTGSKTGECDSVEATQ